MSIEKIQVAVEGGWGSDGSMRLTIADPHNHGTLMELTIPQETFVNALRNFHSYQPPLADAKVWTDNLVQYGWEQQMGTVWAPLPTGMVDDWNGWVQSQVPDGWRARHEPRRNTHQVDNGLYKIKIDRKVPRGTDRTIEEDPGDRSFGEVKVTWDDPEEWGKS